MQKVYLYNMTAFGGANKVSRERKPHKYNCAEEPTAKGKISNERTIQGARARLDRQSAPRKREKEKDTRNRLIPKQGEQRTRTNLKGKQADERNKRNQKKQEQRHILKLHAFYRAYSVQARKDGTGLRLEFSI